MGTMGGSKHYNGEDHDDKDLALNQLNFSRIRGKLYGRTEEVSLLTETLNRVSPLDDSHQQSYRDEWSSSSPAHSQPRSELVLVGGGSGSGKSFLIESTLGNGLDSGRVCAVSDGNEDSGKRRRRSHRRKKKRAKPYFFGSGKFEPHEGGAVGEEPYAAIASALNGLCDQLLRRKSKDDVAEMGRAVLESIGRSNAGVISGLGAPRLKEWLGEAAMKEMEREVTSTAAGKSDDERGSNKTEGHPLMESVLLEDVGSVATAGKPASLRSIGGGRTSSSEKRFQYALRSFLRTICSRSGGAIVLFLDDLQRADGASLGLIEYLLTDPQTSNLMFVCAYRDDEVQGLEDDVEISDDGKSTEIIGRGDSSTHTLARALRSIKMFGAVRVQKIVLGDLSESSVNSLISDLLTVRREITLSLAQSVHKMTHGNSFFVCQFLRALHDEGLLQFNFVTQTWNWADMDEIQSRLSVADNVVSLIVGKVRRLPEEIRDVLTFASCLGSYFRVEVLEMVLAAWIGWPGKEDGPGDSCPASKHIRRESDLAGSCRTGHNQTCLEDWGGRQEGAMDAQSTIDGTNASRIRDLKSPDLIRILTVAELEGIVTEVRIGSSFQRQDTFSSSSFSSLTFSSSSAAPVYKFVHDRVHQAVYSLYPDGPIKDCLHRRIGKLLWQELQSTKENIGTEEDQRWMLFLAARQLNRGLRDSTILDEGFSDMDRIALVELNLAAAEAAMDSSAFLTAMEYLARATEMLSVPPSEGNPWVTHPDLCLRLYSASAEVSYCNGDFVASRRMAKLVLANSKNILDKVRMYDALIVSYTVEGKFRKAMEMGFDALKLLGEKFPRKARPRTIALDVVKTTSMLQTLTDDELLKIPHMVDENKMAAMRILLRLSMNCLYANSGHVPLVIQRMVHLSIEHGMARPSAAAFALYAFMLCGPLQDIKQGVRFGQFAMVLQRRLDSKEYECFTHHTIYTYVNHWREHLHLSLEPLLKAQMVGMQSGDMQHAMLSALDYCTTYIYSGMPLEGVEKDMRSYSPQMLEHKQMTALAILRPMWQFALNLMGKAQDVLVLTGEAMDQDAMVAASKKNNNGSGLVMIYHHQMELAYYFGDLKLAVDCAKKSRKLGYITNYPHFVAVRHLFFNGLIALEMVRYARWIFQEMKWLRHADRAMKKMEKWTKCAAGNVVHMLLLLKAEHASIKGKLDDDKLRSMYNTAVNTASRNGFPHDQALANERAGLFFLRRGNHFWASQYLTRAYELYIEWGAKVKANHLYKTNMTLLISTRQASMGGGVAPRESPISMAFRGRSRFSEISSQHKYNLESSAGSHRSES